MTAARIVEIYARYDLWNEVAAALCTQRKRTIFTDDACGPLYAERDACHRAGVSGCVFPHFVFPDPRSLESLDSRSLESSCKMRISCILR